MFSTSFIIIRATSRTASRCHRELDSCSRTAKLEPNEMERPPTRPRSKAEVVFTRVEAVLAAANMALSDIVRLTVFLTDQADVGTFVKASDGSWVITNQ